MAYRWHPRCGCGKRAIKVHMIEHRNTGNVQILCHDCVYSARKEDNFPRREDNMLVNALITSCQYQDYRLRIAFTISHNMSLSRAGPPLGPSPPPLPPPSSSS